MLTLILIKFIRRAGKKKNLYVGELLYIFCCNSTSVVYLMDKQ